MQIKSKQTKLGIKTAIVQFISQLSLAGAAFGLLATSANAEMVTLGAEGILFRIDTDTLALSGAPQGYDPRVLSDPAINAETSDLVASAIAANWISITEDGMFRISAVVANRALEMSFLSLRSGQLNWPVSAPLTDVQYALPILGEGRRVPANDEDWGSFLHNVLNGLPAAEHQTQNFFTEQNQEYSTTWLLKTPWDANVTYTTQKGLLSVGFQHEFTRLNLDRAYQVSVQFGPANWIDGALINREHLKNTGGFKTLQEKISERPDVAKLAGAPHIYLWEKGPLKPEDVKSWRRFVRIFGNRRKDPGTLSHSLWSAMPDDLLDAVDLAVTEAQGPDGWVSKYSRGVLIHAINAALPDSVLRIPVNPLPGGHDPEAGPGYMLAVREALSTEFNDSLNLAETWGSGMSKSVIAGLSAAGIQTAWLGVENWLDAIWHPEAVALTIEKGYLIGTYDSYASAHAETETFTWQTAQMGTDIFEAGRYQDRTGKPVTGFHGKGVYVNPVAVENYAQSRIKAVSATAGLNSYFLDVDGTGLVFEDYTEGRVTDRRGVYEATKRRLAFASQGLGLVLGSETSTAAFAAKLDFSHGITTPVFDWMDPRMRRNPAPKYYIGNYWPIEAPDRFFEPTQAPPLMERVIYDPAFRLPLFQIALHDAVVTTHHWHFGSLKPKGQQSVNQLFELLYMVPPLYHLSHKTMARDMPEITSQVAAFAPLHKRLMTQAMTEFRFLSDNYLLQETRFADESVLIANFGSKAAMLPDGYILAAVSVMARLPGEEPIIISPAAR